MKLKILHVEDNPQDAELIHALLADEWPDCDVTVVDNQAAFAEQAEHDHDVVLSDFTLPGFDGMEALKLAKALMPERPFIFVSGSIGEERAVEAVRRGAFDYVLKDRMRRLTTCIRRAINDRDEGRRRRAAEAAHLRLASILECTPALVAIMTVEGNLSYLNAAGRKLIGVTPERDVSALLMGDLHPPEAAKRFFEVGVATAITNGSWIGESTLITLDGRRLPISELIVAHRQPTGEVDYISTVIQDLTEKKRLEQQFLRAQRVETIGTLAAGIAHDLNNVLAPIVMGAPILRERMTDPRDAKLLEAMENSAERGTDMVRQILDFARGTHGVMVPLQIKGIIRDVVTVVQETFPKEIEFEHVVAPDLAMVNAHASQIHQVLLNLCINARDAMPGGGWLSLRAGNRVLSEPECRRIPGATPGSYIVLEVADTGTGISPDTLARIWEPFFTTKGTDKGTGLGLSTVRGIVQSHRGFIDLKTQAGKGTTFAVYLPALSTQT